MEFPLLVNATFSELLLPTFTLPKLKLVGLAPNSRVAVTPVPLRLILSGELGESLTSDMEPETLLASVGVKTALNVELFPGVMVNGVVSPLRVKPLPVTLACEIVTLELPAFDKVKACELLTPITTLPKLALVGVTLKAGCTPAPLSATVGGVLLALLATDTLPVTLPVVVGAKVTLKEALCPAARVNGVAIPVVAKALPVTLI